MYKLNFIAVVTIVAAVFSLAVGIASPIAVFAVQHDNTTMNMGNNMSSMMGNMTGGGGGNATTSMAETESLPSANQTGMYCQEGRYLSSDAGCSIGLPS